MSVPTKAEINRRAPTPATPASLAMFAAIRRASSRLALFLFDRSAKVFGERLSSFQIGETSTIASFSFSLKNCTASVSQLNLACLMKIYDPATQCDA
jgi:hypothetical protein